MLNLCTFIGGFPHGGIKKQRGRSVHFARRNLILAMHAGFAFLELGTVHEENQVNALVKILVDFAVSTIAYFFAAAILLIALTFSAVLKCSS